MLPSQERAKIFVPALFGLLLLCWGVFSWPLLSRHEARRAEIIRETLKESSWLIPRYQGKPYVTKPPLFTWAGALSGRILGLKEGALRLPSLVGALITICLTFALTYRYLGLYEALWASLILFSCHKFFLLARRCEPEVPFATLSFLGVSFFWLHLSGRRLLYRYLAFICLGLAFLTKGPLVLFVFPALGAYFLLRKDLKGLKALFDPLGWLLFVLFGLSWYLYAYYQLGPEPFHEFIFVDILGRLKHKHHDPFFQYFLELLANSLPWSLVIFFYPHRWGRKVLKDPFLSFFFVSVFVPVFLLSFTAQKFNKYLLAFYPSWAIVLGAWWSFLLKKRFDIQKTTSLAIILALLIGFAHIITEPYLNRLWLSSLSQARPFFEGKKIYLFRFYHPALAFYAASSKVIEDEKELSKLPSGALLWVRGKDFPQAKETLLRNFRVKAHFKPFLRKGKEAWFLEKKHSKGIYILRPLQNG